MNNKSSITTQKQLTFSEKMIESDMEEFKKTGNTKFYRSAKSISENDNAPYIFSSIKKILMSNPELSLKMNLADGSYWECLKLIAQNRFPVRFILETIKYIHKKTDEDDFKMLIELAEEKLFRYIFIMGDTNEDDLDKIKDRNMFIQIVLSYFDLKNKKSQNEIDEWERSLEENFDKDYEYAIAYHRYWKKIQDYYDGK